MTTLSIRKVRVARDIDDTCVKIHLFRNLVGDVCGWYIGPLGVADGRIVLPYLPRSKETRASLAVVRAIAAAEGGRWDLCLIDPDDLWDPVWRV